MPSADDAAPTEAEAVAGPDTVGAKLFGVTDDVTADDEPLEWVAVTVKVYEVPLVSPVTVQVLPVDDEPETVQVRDPGLAVTVYDVVVTTSGASHVTVTCPSPTVVVRLRGEYSTTAVTWAEATPVNGPSNSAT